VLLALTALASAQLGGIGTTPASKYPQRLDQLAENRLSDPETQVILRLTNRQHSQIQSRRFMDLMKSLVVTARNSAKAQASEDGGTAVNPMSVNFDIAAGPKMTDLTDAQRRLARKLAMQRQVLDSVLTSELELALDITPQQKARLTMLRKNRDAEYNRSFANPAVWKGVFGKDLPMEKSPDEMTDAEFAKLLARLSRVEKNLGKAFADLNARWEPRNRQAERESLALLTSQQRAKLRQLQGPTIRL